MGSTCHELADTVWSIVVAFLMVSSFIEVCKLPILVQLSKLKNTVAKFNAGQDHSFIVVYTSPPQTVLCGSLSVTMSDPIYRGYCLLLVIKE
jgi:hypothetical protein